MKDRDIRPNVGNQITTVEPVKILYDKKKKKSKKVTSRSPFSSFLHVIFSFIGNVIMMLLLIFLLGTAFVCGYVLDIVNNIEAIDSKTIANGLTESSIILDNNGEIIETLFGDSGMRSNIEYEEIGPEMVDAIIAIEDKTFFKHQGFNYIRLVGAFIESIQSGEGAKGTSTITQQLARNVYLSNERALERKIKEAYYAIFLERTLSKEQILEAYLNKIAFGMNANGVQSASQLYFTKDVMDLDLIESAILAGIPKAPSRYAPMKRYTKEQVGDLEIIIDESDEVYTLVFNPESQNRYNAVIQQMFANKMITRTEYDFAYGLDISTYIHPNVDKTNTISSFFGDMIKNDAAEALSLHEGITKQAAEEMLYNRGFIIHSTIDFEKQQTIERLYKAVNMSDTFDQSTYDAVIRFQTKNDLAVDGRPGEATLRLLVEQTSYSIEAFTEPEYYLGMVHEDIVTLKMAFNELDMITNEALFPKVVVMFDENKNIVNDETQKVLIYKYDNVINEAHQLVINKKDYYFDEADNLVLLKNNSLAFYQQTDRVQVVVNKLFTYDEMSDLPRYIDKKNFTSISGLYIYEGRDVLIHDDYKTKVDGNLVIDRTFFNDYPNFFIMSDTGDLLVNDQNYIINKRGEIQPQSAFVLLEHETGYIKAIVGGRESFGQNIYNRALVPHQPGSSIKPIGVYTVAINSRNWTAASVIDDVPTYLNKEKPEERWPVNWYELSAYKYRGRNNLRKGIEDSLNVVTAKLGYALGAKNVIAHLLNLGITTIEEIDGNDINLSAIALGGMTYGISPLELAGAYATYANQGVYIKPISFTKITDTSGNIIIDNVVKKETVIEEQVAFIIQDMMRTAVSVGYAKKAQIRDNNEGIPVAGKTGTTSDKRDALFIGYTPYYTAAIWFGNDVRLKMDEGSGAAAEFWQLVMAEMHKDLPDKDFIEPEGLERAIVDRISGKKPSQLSSLDPAGSQLYTEVFLPGTVPTEIDDAHVKVSICSDSLKMPAENCINIVEVVKRVRLDYNTAGFPIADQIYMVPSSICDIPEHQVEVPILQIIKAFPEGILFVTDYNLLLKSNQMKFIPEGSEILTDYTIVLISGEKILKSQYNIEYILNPETQVQELLRREEESQEDDIME